MRTIIIMAAFLGMSCLPITAQEKLYTLRNDSNTVSRVITAAHLHIPGLYAQQERRLFSQTTLLYGVGVYLSAYTSDDPAGPFMVRSRFFVVTDDRFPSFYKVSSVTPYLFAELRQYFSLKRRVAKEKQTWNNAANYIGIFAEAPLSAGHLTETPNIVMVYPVGMKVGMRRNLSQHVYLDMSLGFLRKLHSGTINTARVDSFVANYSPRLKIDFGYAF